MAAQRPGHVHRPEPPEPCGSREPGQMHARTVAQVGTMYSVRPVPQGHTAATHPWHTPHTEKCSSPMAPQHHTALQGTLAPNSIPNGAGPDQTLGCGSRAPASSKEPKCLRPTFHAAPLALQASPGVGENPDFPSSQNFCPC